ncbi:MAG: 1-deoxy-D-xylulose-5-phosphate synthase [Ruminococcaceae bacterium]|nr:1-deoxy-D-xylulose-5-phosphate synthase [Oscillospiraceae bacterium]
MLDKIQTPEDVKKLNSEALIELAADVRAFLIESVSKTGGHLASNLGVVELTIALFYCLDLPRDGIVWDVGHQSYVHKLLTGRRAGFDTLRKLGGLSGFPKCSESVYDCFNTGHSSTAISAAFGMTKAAALKGEETRFVAVVGDGALTGGMAFEALNDAGTYQKNFIVVLNDNEMSIAKNVGGLSKYLTKLRTRPLYNSFKSGLERSIRHIPYIGENTVLGLKKVKDAVRHLLTSTTVFEDLGFTYLGPIDGHDLPFLCRVIQQAKKINGPVLIHAVTTKGKGYSFAEASPTHFHGIGAFEVETGMASQGYDSYATVMGKKLSMLAEGDETICAVTAAMPDGTGLRRFMEHYPERFFDVGIAEQHALTFSAGLSKQGLTPVVAIYSTFLQRAYDQVLHDVCLQKLRLVLCVDRAGVVGEDGETHQGLYDIAYLLHMPNMTLLAPANFSELEEMLSYAVKDHRGPIAIRYPRGNMQENYIGARPFVLGQSDWVCHGGMVCLMAAGHMLQTAMVVKKFLETSHITATVLNLRSLQPLDQDAIREAAKTHSVLVTIEDGIAHGGVGERIASLVHDMPVRVLIKAHRNGIVPQGTCSELYAKCGLDAKTITEEILDIINGEKQHEKT